MVDLPSGVVTTVVSKTEQIPGIVAWSPTGDVIAYAAVPAERTGEDFFGTMTFENPAITARRIYLLDPETGDYRRLNDHDGYQDMPTWSDDGAVLYYVRRDPESETLVLVAADPETGEAEPIEASRRRARADTRVGWYGQADWDEMLEYAPKTQPER